MDNTTGEAVSAAFVVAAFSEVGRRGRNEDRVGTSGTAGGRLHAWTVADGLGGHDAGDVAAQAAVDAALGRVDAAPADAALEDVVRTAMEAAQDAVLRVRARLGAHSEAATTIALAVSDGESVACGHAGDSRLYRLREGRAELLTRDHTVAESMRALAGTAQGQSAASEHSNTLISALGIDGALLDVGAAEPLQANDVFLICSDGLWAHVPERALAADRRAAADLTEWLDRLRQRVEDANDPHQDNYTGIAFCAEAESQNAPGKTSFFARLLQRS